MKSKPILREIIVGPGILFILCILLTISGCRKNTTEPEPAITDAQNTGFTNRTMAREDIYREGDVILGKQLQNPYTIDIMKQAYDNVIKKGIFSTYPVNIRETYYYVRFKPKTWDEYDDLKEDSTLELSDIPYDYSISVTGNYYHDRAIPDSLPTFQYATVPVDFHFNDTISYEVLSPIYVPEVDTDLMGVSDENETFVDYLLNEAYLLTGNYEDTLDMAREASRRPKFTPGGNIRIFDTRLATNYGMEGIKVTARRWFIVYSANADFFGNYRMSHSFRRPCNYSAWFEFKRFLVKKGGVHWINGPKQTGDWNHLIADGFDRFAGHIFRAAYRYHYKDIGGLQRPFRWLGRKTAYIAKDVEGSGAGVNQIVFNNIKIWRYKGKGIEYGSDEVFSTTSHETGHTSHVIRMNTVIQYWQVSRQLQESWAVAIEWFVTHLEYASRGINNYGEFNYFPTVNPPDYPNSYAYQYWAPAISDRYTNIYIDIVDNHNELGVAYLNRPTGTVDDQVNGYTLPFIESEMLKHIYGLASLADELKGHRPAGVTDAQIDRLISFY
jgi:hypothetical protein